MLTTDLFGLCHRFIFLLVTVAQIEFFDFPEMLHGCNMELEMLLLHGTCCGCSFQNQIESEIFCVRLLLDVN